MEWGYIEKIIHKELIKARGVLSLAWSESQLKKKKKKKRDNLWNKKRKFIENQNGNINLDIT